MRRRFTRKQRRQLEESAARYKAEALASLPTTDVPVDRPTPEEIALWFGHSLGSWRRGFRAAE